MVDKQFGLAGSTREYFRMAVATRHGGATVSEHTLTTDIRLRPSGN